MAYCIPYGGGSQGGGVGGGGGREGGGGEGGDGRGGGCWSYSLISVNMYANLNIDSFSS